MSTQDAKPTVGQRGRERLREEYPHPDDPDGLTRDQTRVPEVAPASVGTEVGAAVRDMLTPGTSARPEGRWVLRQDSVTRKEWHPSIDYDRWDVRVVAETTGIRDGWTVDVRGADAYDAETVLDECPRVEFDASERDVPDGVCRRDAMQLAEAVMTAHGWVRAQYKPR
jgi:hypothetical protein